MDIIDYKKVLSGIGKYVGIYYRYPQTPVLAAALRDSLSPGQLRSKLRAVELLAKHTWWPRRGFFIGHWHGLLPRFMHQHNLVDEAAGCELDPFWTDFSLALNDDWQWSSSGSDIYAVDASGRPVHNLSTYSLVVNTSCEHMNDDWLSIPAPGTIVCAQSTDYEHPTHINTVSSAEEFASKFTDYQILALDAQDHGVYNRYTVIASKPRHTEI